MSAAREPPSSLPAPPREQPLRWGHRDDAFARSNRHRCGRADVSCAQLRRPRCRDRYRNVVRLSFVRGRAHQSRDQRDGPRPERVGPYRKNRYLMSAAAPRTSTMTASRTIRLSAQFQTIYVSWSIMSAITYLSPLHIHHRNYAPPFLRISLHAPRALIAFMLAQP